MARAAGQGQSWCGTPPSSAPSGSRSSVSLLRGYAQFAQACQDYAEGMADACGPKSPDSHRVVWGLTSRPPGSLRAFLRFPVCPPGSFPFARLRLVSLRPAFSGCSLRPQSSSGSPSVSLRFPFPWAIVTLAPPRGDPPGVGPERQGPRSPVPPRLPPVDRATAGTTDERPVTMRFRYIIARQARLRTPDIDPPQSRRTAAPDREGITGPWPGARWAKLPAGRAS
jgi:hypothetical protein